MLNIPLLAPKQPLLIEAFVHPLYATQFLVAVNYVYSVSLCFSFRLARCPRIIEVALRGL